MPQVQNPSPASDPAAYLPRHQLRIRRWLMASTFYILGVPLVLYGLHKGQVAAIEAWTFVLLATLGNLWLGWMFSTRGNERWQDPSLTVPQMLLAILSTLVFAGGATASLRPTISLGLLAPLIFGCFQLQPRQLLRLALFAMAGYGVMLALVWFGRGISQPIVELTHWMGLNLMLAAFVAICGEITRMRDRQRQLATQLKESADRDALTGLYNRRWLARQWPPAIELAQRHQRPYAVCMLDIDFFKQINDKFGHLAGDAALQWVTGEIQSLLRQTDSLVRVGGEEFLLLLPETDLHGAYELADRICRHLARSRFVPAEEAEPLQITLSIGVTQLRPGDTSDQAMFRADSALYAAKRQGRNRAVSAGV